MLVPSRVINGLKARLQQVKQSGTGGNNAGDRDNYLRLAGLRISYLENPPWAVMNAEDITREADRFMDTAKALTISWCSSPTRRTSRFFLFEISLNSEIER